MAVLNKEEQIEKANHTIKLVSISVESFRQRKTPQNFGVLMETINNLPILEQFNSELKRISTDLIFNGVHTRDEFNYTIARIMQFSVSHSSTKEEALKLAFNLVGVEQDSESYDNAVEFMQKVVIDQMKRNR